MILWMILMRNGRIMMFKRLISLMLILVLKWTHMISRRVMLLVLLSSKVK